MPFKIICKSCGKDYESKYSGKIYCTRECYHGSPEFKAMLKANSEKVAKAKLAESGWTSKQSTFECFNCGQSVPTKPSRKKGGHKYCSRKCYREYQAARFDRYIASPQSLALPQNYDEFLTGDELHCLVEGCGWSGVQLSSHMNFSHGIKKDKFKEMAGFNASTGVVTADYAHRLSESKKDQGWGAEHMAYLRSLVKVQRIPPSALNMRLEGKEHAAKSRMLMEIPDLVFTCLGCGTISSANVRIKKYCSVECRDQHYREIDTSQEKIYPVPCEVCHKIFKGTAAQKQRHEQGLVTVCSFTCRQKRAGHIARGTWHGR